MKALLLAQSREHREEKSGKIQKKLFEHAAFRKAGVVCFYVALPMEVNTHPMIEEALKMGKKVLVPLADLENKELKLYEIRNLAADLTPGILGILEPLRDKTRLADPKEAECVIVPGLAFSMQGRRLGRGAGFYDRFLSKLSAKIPKIALAFSFQVITQIPQEIHDCRVDTVLTEK
jgi:5-formyltetrahydrofolate cyclo-ligase